MCTSMALVAGTWWPGKIRRCHLTPRTRYKYLSILCDFLLRNPGCHACIEHVERQRSTVQDFIVKGTDIVTGSKVVFRKLPEFKNFELAELVRQRLSRYRDVTVSFGLQVGFIIGSVLVEEIDH